MHQLITFEARLLVKMSKRIALVTGLGICLTCGAAAADFVVSEQTFGCILDWPKVRNTHIKHDDPEKLNEAIRMRHPFCHEENQFSCENGRAGITRFFGMAPIDRITLDQVLKASRGSFRFLQAQNIGTFFLNERREAVGFILQAAKRQ